MNREDCARVHINHCLGDEELAAAKALVEGADPGERRVRQGRVPEEVKPHLVKARRAVKRAAPSERELALLRELNDASHASTLALADLYRARAAEVSALENRAFWFSLSATQGNLTEAGAAAALRAAPGAT